MLADYHLRLVDRGVLNGVPCVNVYLIRTHGESEYAAMSATNLSPVTADELADAYAQLGVRVERVRQPAQPAAEPWKGRVTP